MSNFQHKLFLIDGHALAYRVFFGLPIEQFTTKSGETTNAVFGFTRQIFDVIFAPEPPKYFAVSFDVGKTFRDEMFPDYKGTREKMPDELRTQIERIKKVVQALNIPILTLENYEADDVLGTIAALAKPLGVPVHILTGDRDLLQLVDDNTTIELPPTKWQRGKQVFDSAQKVVDKLGVRPDQVVDYKAIVGDASDNIPGVKGVGEKTVTKLLADYDTLDAIYENIAEIKARFANKLIADKDSAYMSQTLAKIVIDAPVEFDLEACANVPFDVAPVLDMFHDLEFRSLSQRLIDNTGYESDDDPFANTRVKEKAPDPTEAILVRTSTELKQMVTELSTSKEIAFDLETTGLDKQTTDIVGIALCGHSPKAYYIPVGHTTGGQAAEGQMGLFAEEVTLSEGQLPIQEVLDAIRPIMTNPKIGKIAHNAKFDFSILNRYGVTVAPITFDTMIGEWLTDPDTKFKGLKNLSQHRLRIEMTEIVDLIGSGRKQISFAEVPIEDAAPYAAADADITLRLAPILQAELEKLGLNKLLELEMALIPILSDMESQGVSLDQEFFKTMSVDLLKRLAELEGDIHKIAGREFKVSSTQQLSEVLFLEMDLPHERLKKTKSGHFSTAANVLNDLKPLDESGIIEKIIEFRELGKLHSTYVDALPKLINPNTQRIHTSFNQTGTVTGRIASQNPNLQNIPIRTEVGRMIRKGFIARPGWVFIAADYSQVELRILAHISQDEALLQAFKEDQDIHTTTAAKVYGIKNEEVQFEQRRFAKAVNFGLIYGMGAFRLARDSDLTLSESKEFIDTYFARFPGVRKYLDETKLEAAEEGYVSTLFGRRRYFPIFARSGNSQFKAQAEREAINHPIQGTAADIVKVSMLQLHEKLLASYKARMVLQVHDELVLEVPEDEVDAVRQLVIDTMSNAYKLDVPLKVEASVGVNWYELKE
ncbi:MAG: DNA polymerase-1 [Cellvibrionaceae bacterium]|jgi:DNA polymerase-1